MIQYTTHKTTQHTTQCTIQHTAWQCTAHKRTYTTHIAYHTGQHSAPKAAQHPGEHGDNAEKGALCTSPLLWTHCMMESTQATSTSDMIHGPHVHPTQTFGSTREGDSTHPPCRGANTSIHPAPMQCPPCMVFILRPHSEDLQKPQAVRGGPRGGGHTGFDTDSAGRKLPRDKPVPALEPPSAQLCSIGYPGTAGWEERRGLLMGSGHSQD